MYTSTQQCALPHCCKCKYLPWYFCFFLFCSLFVCCYILDFRVTTDECAPHRNITMLILDSQKPFFFLLLLLDFSHGWIALTANAFNALPISMNSALNRNCNKNATSRTVKVHKGAADKSMLQQQKNINVFFLCCLLLSVVVIVDGGCCCSILYCKYLEAQSKWKLFSDSSRLYPICSCVACLSGPLFDVD